MAGWIILFNLSFYSISLAEEISVAPLKAFVTSVIASVTREPNPDSDLVVQLKEGEGVEVLETEGTYSKIRYRIEGEYPVTGWIPTAVLSKPGANSPRFSEQGQAYVSESKFSENTELKDFPDLKMTEKVILPTNAQKLKMDPKKIEPPAPPPISNWKPFGLANELTVSLGFQSWQDDLTTKQTSGAYFSGPFLKYELRGPTLEVRDEVLYKLSDRPLSFGGLIQYRFTFFSDSIDANNSEIAQSGIQAQFHEVEVHPFVRASYSLSEGWTLEPQLGPSFGFHSFVTNQLRDMSPTNPNRIGQSVLFGVSAYYLKAEFRPQVRSPWNLRFLPILSMNFFYSFSEYPSSSDPQSIRTGSPNGGSIAFSYGGEMGWNLKQLRNPNAELVFKALFQTFPRNYSGAGNRAGEQTLDVKAEASTALYCLGYQYLF